MGGMMTGMARKAVEWGGAAGGILGEDAAPA